MTLNETVRSYSRAVDQYEAGRPDYPAALVAALPLSGAHTVVELGAGTGKFTRLMLPHLDADAQIIAVEPVADMAAKLAGLNKVRVLNRTAADTGLAAAFADVVVCAQSFHWFDNEASVAEIARILRPRGVLALIWNVRDDSVAWVGAITRLVDEYAGDTPRQKSNHWRWVLSDARFSFDGERAAPHPHLMTREGVHARVLSTSFIAKLADAQKQDLSAKIDASLDAHGFSGAAELTMPYVTRLYLLSRRNTAPAAT